MLVGEGGGRRFAIRLIVEARSQLKEDNLSRCSVSKGNRLRKYNSVGMELDRLMCQKNS
jgi:hypothetical protein